MLETSCLIAGSFALAYVSILLVCSVAYRWDRVVVKAIKKLPFTGVVYL